MSTDALVAMQLARVAAMNPDAVRLAAQLLGVPPCPECDYVMRPGHACEAMRVQTAKPLRPSK